MTPGLTRYFDCINFSKSIEGVRIEEAVFSIDVTLLWYDEGELSKSGGFRCVGVFVGRNLENPGALGNSTPEIGLCESDCEIIPCCLCCNCGCNCCAAATSHFWYYSYNNNTAYHTAAIKFSAGESVALKRGFDKVQFYVHNESSTTRDYFAVVDVVLHEYN